MKIQLYDSITEYARDIMNFAVRHEIQNNLIIGNCIDGQNGRDSTGWFMAAVKDEHGVPLLAAMMTPPHYLLIFEINNIANAEALNMLVNVLAGLGHRIPGVLAEKSLADRFSESFEKVSGKIRLPGKNLRIYRLDEVADVAAAKGSLRPADEGDLYFLPHWNLAFNLDCGHKHMNSIQEAEIKVRNTIDGKRLFVWQDGIPVSQAAIGRRTMNGAIINAVYTPPYYRNKGYATACVAGLSKYALENGYKFCSLFTDLANPVSNSIYMKMGYKPVCDYDEYSFAEVE